MNQHFCFLFLLLYLSWKINQTKPFLSSEIIHLKHSLSASTFYIHCSVLLVVLVVLGGTSPSDCVCLSLYLHFKCGTAASDVLPLNRVGPHCFSECVSDKKSLRISVAIRSASLNTIKFPRQLLFHTRNLLPSLTPTCLHHMITLPFVFTVCSRRHCSTKELETASSNAASVEKPSNTNITWRSIFVFTAVSRFPPETLATAYN